MREVTCWTVTVNREALQELPVIVSYGAICQEMRTNCTRNGFQTQRKEESSAMLVCCSREICIVVVAGPAMGAGGQGSWGSQGPASHVDVLDVHPTLMNIDSVTRR